MKRLCAMFQKLPLCGKFAIKRSIYNVIYSRSAGERSKNMVLCVLLLSTFVVLHSEQARMGFELLKATRYIPVIAFGALYTLVNALAAWIQSYLLLRTVIISCRCEGHYIKDDDRRTCYVSTRSEIISIIFTLTGQIIFLALYEIFV